MSLLISDLINLLLVCVHCLRFNKLQVYKENFNTLEYRTLKRYPSNYRMSKANRFPFDSFSESLTFYELIQTDEWTGIYSKLLL